MQKVEERHVRGIRNLLREARAENSRVVAAAIGDHLFKLDKRSGGNLNVAEAADGLRDASLHFLKSLHLGQDTVAAREAALAAVAPLEASLPKNGNAPARQGRPASGAFPASRKIARSAAEDEPDLRSASTAKVAAWL
jgi:hypothetical protein